jgi:hypothetical protein
VKQIRLSLDEARADSISVNRFRLLAAVLAMAAVSLPLSAQHGSEKAVAAAPRSSGMVIESLDLHLALAGMRAAQAPRVIEGHLVLSASGPYRTVAAAFAHEGFAKLHPFERNKQGVFVFAYPVPLKWEEGKLEYRVVVDGVWTIDPTNPDRTCDPASGLEVSFAAVPYLSDLRLGLYKILDEDGSTARFVFRGAAGESVAVCGDFNNWDPFIHELRETSPGLYQLDLPLPKGRHYYDFVYRGEELPDPLNPVRAASRDGRQVSVLVVD